MSLEPADNQHNRIEDVMNGNMEDMKTEESLSSRDSFLTSSDNDDDDPVTLNESYTSMTITRQQNTNNDDEGVPDNNTFSSLISDCDIMCGAGGNKDFYDGGGRKKLNLSDSDVSSGEEGGHNVINNTQLYTENYEGEGVTVHLEPTTATPPTTPKTINEDETNNIEVKDQDEVYEGEQIMQASLVETQDTQTNHIQQANFASLHQQKDEQNTSVDEFDDTKVLDDNAATTIDPAADLVIISEETAVQDVQIKYEQSLTETFVEDVTVNLSETDVWDKRTVTDTGSEHMSSMSSTDELSTSSRDAGVSDKLRNPELSAIQEKRVTTMIQRIEKISKTGGQFNHKLSASSLLDSPRISASPRDSPRLTAGPKDSPRLSAGSRDSPRLSAGPRDSPRLTAGPKDSPRMDGGARKVDIVVDSYEVQLEKSLELTTRLSGDGEGRGGIVKDPVSVSGGLDRTDTPARSSIHRVTFNTRNEVASEDTDGSLLVTYCPLEERIRRRRDRSPVPPGREPYKVKYVDRNSPMTSSPRVIDFHDSTFEEEESQQNTSSENEGWENPFQPEGPVSHDADLILRLWKGGNLPPQDLDTAISQLQAEEERAKQEAERLAAAEAERLATEAAKLEAEERAKADKEAESKDKVSDGTSNGGHNQNRGHPTSLVNIDKQKHKNLLKKHCSLM